MPPLTPAPTTATSIRANLLPTAQPAAFQATESPCKEASNKDTEAGSGDSQTEEGFLSDVAETPFQDLLRSCVTEGTRGQDGPKCRALSTVLSARLQLEGQVTGFM
ncbi:hypothetical protein MC885_002291 [Smutsia gigantea]|nr:hypothetical protein MC885_002291 [Smutsia gigantea]